MPRPLNPDLNKPWKVLLPATLAGRIEFMLIDPIHKKPIYAARAKLLSSLLEWWIARESGADPAHLPSVPSLLDLRKG